MKRYSVYRALAVTLVLIVVTSSFAVIGASGNATVSSAPSAPVAASQAASTPLVPASSGPVLQQTASQHAALANKVSTVMADAVASGIKPDLLHLPNINPAPVRTTSAISPGYTKAPAPMGVSYYGVSGSGSTVTVVDSSSVWGGMSFQNLSALYIDSTSPDQMGAQINALANNATLQGKSTYDYWTQNVIAYYTTSQTVQFVQNTWNFSSTAEAFPSSGQSSVVANSSGMELYEGIYLGTGPTFYAPPPFTLNLYLNSSVVGSTYTLNAHQANQAIVYAGDQELWYNYTLTDPHTGLNVAGNYNWLIFNSTNPKHTWTTNGPGGLPFEASGSKTNAATGLDADYEMDIGLGAFDGANQDMFNINGTATEAYVNDCSGRTATTPATCARTTGPGSGYGFTPVPAAYDCGSQTGETSTGTSIGYTTTGGDTAVFSTGPSILHGLWGYTTTGISAGTVKLVNNVKVSGAPNGPTNGAPTSQQPYIFFFAEDTAFTASGYAWMPDVPSWSLMPGTYNYEAMLSDYQEQTGSFVLTSTTVTFTATLPYQSGTAGAGVYTPLWATNNAQLAGISSSGTGAVNSQYKLFNNAVATGCTLCGSATANNLSASFYSPNDYDFPSFTGIQLMNTNLYVNVNNPAPTAQWSSVHDYLQIQFFNTTHVTLSNGTALRGMSMPAIGIALASQNILPQAAVTFWNTTDSLVYHNTFFAWKAVACADSSSLPCSPNENLLMYNAASVNAGNVIWNNTFRNPPGVALGTTYGGISVAENGDTIANNYFDVDNPVVAMFFNIYTEVCQTNVAGYCVLWPYVDAWNVANQSSSTVTVVNGVPLTGSVSGSSFQGGNLWWNYGNSLNPFTPLPYVDTFAYTDLVTDDYVATADQASIYGAADQIPLVPGIAPSNPGYLYTLSITQSGLSGSWTVTVTGTTAAGTTSPAWTETIGTITRTQTGATMVPIALPQGTYTVTVTGPTGTNPSWNATGAPPTSYTSSSSNHYTMNWQQRWSVGISKATATGLPSGTRWFVNFTSISYSSGITGTGNAFNLWLPNGSYTYTVQAANYASTPGTGTLYLNGGSPTGITVTHFVHITYSATFSVAGLSSGTSWRVWLNGSYHSASAPTSAVATGLANGTYNYTVTSIAGYSASPRVGTIVIAGAGVTQPVVFSSSTYVVTFTAVSGLPVNAVWAVTLNNVLSWGTYTGPSSTITFSEPNGSYNYVITVFGATQYTITPHASGTVSVAGAAAGVSATFTAIVPTYSVYFTESNLPGGTMWSVTLNGNTESSTSATIIFSGLAAGAYPYTFPAIMNYNSPAGSSVTVTSAPVSISVAYTATTYTVTFTEVNLPGGTTWAVVFGGTVYFSATSTIVIQVMAGTYTWQAAAFGGYTVVSTSSPSPVTISGATGITVTFS